jgi:hypothetical protein
MLRFGNQPKTTGTGRPTRDGHNSEGDPIRVEFYDPATKRILDSDAEVTLTLERGSDRGKLVGGTAQAVGGVATFANLSIDTPGLYTLKATSTADKDTTVSQGFMVADTVDICNGPGCSFKETTNGGHTYTTTPAQGSAGARWASSVNLPGVRMSSESLGYSDARQPNAIWYSYDDGDTLSAKEIEIFIDKSLVDQTEHNELSAYRITYSSPVPFTDRSGGLAKPDPSDGDGPSAYFGTTWYIGLLPDCDEHDPVAPCVVKWSDDGGNRIATVLTPPGDPFIR